jgi:glycosyltransferase involved in cell wall biosynthesis
MKPPVQKVAWLGSVRYSNPLSTTDLKKWQMLSEGLPAQIYVMAFSQNLRPHLFTQHAHFYLLPLLPLAPLRYIFILSVIPLFVWWFMVWHGVRVFVAQSPYEGASAAFALGFTKLFGAKTCLIVEAHNDYENNLFTLKKVSFENLYRRTMAIVGRYGILQADRLRSVSRSTQAQLQAIAPSTPMVRFMTWTDVSAFENAQRTMPLSQATDIVYVGVITQLKGVHTLLEAFAQQDSAFQLLLIGAEEQPDYAQQLRQRITELNLQTRVVWCGKLPQQALAEKIVNAKVLVLPSQSEGLPRVIIEAMTCGTPVIATRVGGIPEVLQSGENGYLIEPNDIHGLSVALKTVLSADESALNHLTQLARQTAQATFSTQAYLQGYKDLIQS